MTAIQWAKTVRCDWPECKSEGEVTLSKEWPDRTMPAGWLDLGQLVSIRDLRGRDVREICSLHTAASIADLARVFTKEQPA